MGRDVTLNGTRVVCRFGQGERSAPIVARILAMSFDDASTVLDLTPGRGGFWGEQTSLCISLSTADFRHLPTPDASYDVCAFDPPHIADAGRDSIMGTKFGTYRTLSALESAVRQGAREAWRVARLGTIVKVTDAMHASRFIRMSGWIYDELGEPYDVVHQVRSRPLIDPRWREPQLSARNNGSTYLVFRKDGSEHRRRGIGVQPRRGD
jgi:hypothetical protein